MSITANKLMAQQLRELAQANHAEVVAIRRHIHRHPELSNKEYKTTEFIREKLTEYGVEIAEIGMKTGVVAVIRGGKPGKTVAIREDIDLGRHMQDAVQSLRICLAADESVRTGQPVTL